MELTIEQVLQQGIEAHREGKLAEAKRLYQAILQAQPLHPDANHNLGVLSVSVNNVHEALLLFKTAIEANPKMEQFWLSYIDVLIKDKQFDNAKKAIEQGKKQGVSVKKLDTYGSKVEALGQGRDFKSIKRETTFSEKRKKLAADKKTKKLQKQKGKGSAPSKTDLVKLIEYYQTGQYGDAEKLAVFITQKFPKHQFSWKFLGMLFGLTGRHSLAVNANQKAVLLSPQDAEAHNNLGASLRELGRLDEAETSCKQAIALKSDYAEAHSNLGNTLYELGRLDEATGSYSLAIALQPEFSEAYSNMGATLQELGRLDEAEASYKQAIVLRPDYAHAHSNLGNTLKEAGRLDEAKVSYTQAIAFKPDYADAHYNLGNTLKELGRLDEAEASYTQAIALKPDYVEAHNNLGNMLKEIGRLDESEASYTQAIGLKPDYAEAMLNCSITQRYMNNIEAEIVSLQNVLRIDSDDHGLKAGVNLAICNFLEGDFTESKKHLLATTKIQEKTSSASKNERVYWIYLSNILKWHENKYLANKKEKNDKNLYVLGESHSLSSHHLRIQNAGIVFFCSARLVKGCKQWHLGNAFRNKYKNQFESIFCSLPKSSEVLLAIGEIDCRLNSGIIKHKNQFPEKEMKEIIQTTVKNYLTFIKKCNFGCDHNIIIQGVPCPNINAGNNSEKEVTQLIELIKNFNRELKSMSKGKEFKFLDVHKLTDRGDGFSNAIWHIDSIHLSPKGFLEAWSRYVQEHTRLL